MKARPQHVLFLCREAYFHSFDAYILNNRGEISKLQAVEVHMHHGDVQLRKKFPRNYDVILAYYDVSPSCRFSHATAHIYICINNAEFVFFFFFFFF